MPPVSPPYPIYLPAIGTIRVLADLSNADAYLTSIDKELELPDPAIRVSAADLDYNRLIWMIDTHYLSTTWFAYSD
jgi:hypothetical protein